jgi:hypothetical protein
MSTVKRQLNDGSGDSTVFGINSSDFPNYVNSNNIMDPSAVTTATGQAQVLIYSKLLYYTSLTRPHSVNHADLLEVPFLRAHSR